MRDYSKVSPKFWIGQTGRTLRKHGMETQLVAMYLLTNPHANMLGLYYIPQTFIAHETGLGFEGASKGLRSCIEAGFCLYDDDSEMVWVMEMARFQIADHLEGKDLRIKGVQNEYGSIPNNPYLSMFYDKYATSFCMDKRRESSKPLQSPLQAPSKPLVSQEQEQEQEQKQEQEQGHEQKPLSEQSPDESVSAKVERRGIPEQATTTAVAKVIKPRGDAGEAVRTVFTYWQRVLNHPRAQLDAKREKAIKARLKDGYTVEDLCVAVDGCSRSAYHMGQNDTRTLYNDIELICRDGPKVDGFIKKATVTPGGPQRSNAQQQTIDNLTAYLQGEQP